jgi:hypothetical protein
MVDGGQNVPFDLPAVTVPGGLGQVDLLPGKPAGGQVGAEGERTDLIVASVDLGGKAGR